VHARWDIAEKSTAETAVARRMSGVDEMRAFEFNLASVLKVRERKKRLAEMRQIQAQELARQRQAELADLRLEANRLAETMAKIVREKGDAQTWPAIAAQIPALNGRIRGAEKRVAEAETLLRQAEAQLRQASIAVEALLVLKRKKRQAYDAEVEAADRQRIEEFTLRQWMEAAREEEAEGKESS
jgi:flagellar export protein FliJ